MTLVSLAPQKGQCMVAGNKNRKGRHGSASRSQDKSWALRYIDAQLAQCSAVLRVIGLFIGMPVRAVPSMNGSCCPSYWFFVGAVHDATRTGFPGPGRPASPLAPP